MLMLLSQFSFLLLLTFFGVLPLILLWIKYGWVLKHYRKTLILVTFCCALLGGLWQYLAIKQGIWAYSGKGTVGIWVFGVPLEEHLFDIVVGSLIAHVTLIIRAQRDDSVVEDFTSFLAVQVTNRVLSRRR